MAILTTSTSPSAFNYTPTIEFYNCDDMKYDNTRCNGDIKVGGDIYVDGKIYQKENEVKNMKEENHDIKIDVAYNGYIASVGDKQFVFDSINSLTDWLSEVTPDPQKGKKFIEKHDKTKIGYKPFNIPDDFVKNYQDNAKSPWDCGSNINYTYSNTTDDSKLVGTI